MILHVRKEFYIVKVFFGKGYGLRQWQTFQV